MESQDYAYTVDQVELRASEILKDHWNKSFPVNPVLIAESLGYQVYEFSTHDADLKEISGVIDHTEKKISVAKDDPPQRSRFTVAHEIGHAVLHPQQDHIDYRQKYIFDIKEQQANRFAAALLMPSIEFKKIFKLFGDYSQIASYFGVSEIAARIRASELGMGCE